MLVRSLFSGQQLIMSCYAGLMKMSVNWHLINSKFTHLKQLN